LDRVYRPSHSANSRHAAEMALRAFDRVFGEPAEAIIEKVKRKKLARARTRALEGGSLASTVG